MMLNGRDFGDVGVCPDKHPGINFPSCFMNHRVFLKQKKILNMSLKWEKNILLSFKF